jgi:hypothetical protein
MSAHLTAMLTLITACRQRMRRGCGLSAGGPCLNAKLHRQPGQDSGHHGNSPVKTAHLGLIDGLQLIPHKARTDKMGRQIAIAGQR